MKWLERFLGPSDHRRYGDNEYYEYPRNGVISSGSSSSGSGTWDSGLESDYGSCRSWRGPSIFEDPYAVDTFQNVVPDRRHSYGGGGYSSRDTSKYVSQYGSTTEIYHPSSGRFRQSGYGYGYGQKEQPPASYTRRYKTEGYDRSEDLAKAFEDSLHLRYPASYVNDAPMVAPLPIPVAAPTTKNVGLSTCAGCHRTLGFGRFLTCINQNWHPDCFCCKSCRSPIVTKEFSVHGSDPYHRDCYKKLFHPKCEICYQYISYNAQGQIEYRSHPFWNQRYCPSHERDGSKCCCSCDRIEPVDRRYQSLGDGRKVCPECMESAVMTTKDCQPLYKNVLKFYRVNLGMPIEQDVPMLLVEREALNKAREVENDGHTHTPETRGLCLSEEKIFPVVENGGEPRKLTRHCEITAILVLYGLPMLLTGSILAHELMHAFIRLNGQFPNLENDVEEGICQVIAHMWLKAELENLTRRTSGSDDSSVSKRLGEFFLHQIETDSSQIYGDGFRAASKAVAAYGLPRTLHHLRRTGEILR